MDDLLELTGRAEATHFWFRGFRAFVVPILEEISAGRRDLRLVDCGCGTGNNLSLLEPYGQTFGFDLTSEGARRALRTERPIVQADIERIPYHANTFDIATSFDVVQSVPDDGAALREMARVLKPGGYAVLNVTALEFLRADHAEVWKELRRYTPASAGRLVGDSGLQVVRISFVFASLFPIMLSVRMWQKLLRPFREPQGDSELEVPPEPINAALTWLVEKEAALSRRVPMPIGSSLLIVARKPRPDSIRT
jgi:SAM-dependent methyltransferase